MPYDYYIVGLGNPGSRYENTRHNLGFMLVDAVASRMKKRDSPLWGQSIFLFKPNTFMNRSGEAVAELVRKYKMDTARRLIVAYDDLDIGLGTVRFRMKGSAGTHNGMDSVISHLGTGEFPRIRLGIGPKPPGLDAADFVLSEFSQDEKSEVKRMLDKACVLLETIIMEGLQKAASKHHE